MSPSRIRPLDEDQIPNEVQSTYERLRDSLGGGSNFLRTAAHSRASLAAFDCALSALTGMRIAPRTRRAIDLRVAQLNGCQYCLAENVEAGRRMGLSAVELRHYRLGRSDDPREQALLTVATKLVLDRGHHTALAVDTARELGVGDDELVEVALLVGLGGFENYLSSLADIELESPRVEAIHGREASR